MLALVPLLKFGGIRTLLRFDCHYCIPYMPTPSFRYFRPTEDVERYLRDISALPQPDVSELAGLFDRAKAGDMEAREKVMLSHLRLVVRVACQYVGYGLPLGDMISEGNLGLLRAVELYDARHGAAFETYASVWIKQRIHRAITSQAKAVRVPIWRSQRLRKLDRLHEELNAELGRDATLQDLADRMGLEEDEVAAITRDRMQVESLDAAEEPSLALQLVDETHLLPGEKLSHDELLEEIYACLDDLDDAELQVLSLKFGLLDQEPESYREMAAKLGRNREWIRKAGERALNKVRESVKQMASIPRRMVSARRQRAAERLKKLKKSPQTLSLQNLMLIQWLEPLMTHF